MALPIISDIIDAVGDIFSEVVVDEDKRNEINLELEKLRDAGDARLHAEMLAQAEINKVEAASGSVFVAGWRPFIGWTGGVALAWSYIIGPFLSFAFDQPLPELNVYELLVLVGGMLGFGGQRTFEKIRGVSTNDYTDVPVTPVVKPKKKILGITLPDKAPWE